MSWRLLTAGMPSVPWVGRCSGCLNMDHSGPDSAFARLQDSGAAGAAGGADHLAPVEAFAGHEVATAADLAWHKLKLKDRELVPLLQGRFDALVTMDRGFEFEHNLKKLTLGHHHSCCQEQSGVLPAASRPDAHRSRSIEPQASAAHLWRPCRPMVRESPAKSSRQSATRAKQEGGALSDSVARPCGDFARESGSPYRRV